MPGSEGGGWDSNLNWGLKATAASCYLRSPSATFQTLRLQHLKLLDFQLGKVFINADVLGECRLRLAAFSSLFSCLPQSWKHSVSHAGFQALGSVFIKPYVHGPELISLSLLILDTRNLDSKARRGIQQRKR